MHKDGIYVKTTILRKTEIIQRRKLCKDRNCTKTEIMQRRHCAIFLFTLLSWDPFIRIFFKHMPSPTGTVLSTMKHVSCRRKQLESIENLIMYFLNTLVNLGRFVRGRFSLYCHCKLRLDNTHLKNGFKKKLFGNNVYNLSFELQHYYILLI